MDGGTRNNARRDFYERIGTLSMAPLWESLHQLVPGGNRRDGGTDRDPLNRRGAP